MKNTELKSGIIRSLKNTCLFLSFLLISIVVAFAQPQISTPEVDVNISEKNSYGSWWMWAIGIGVFIIIIVAITNRGRRRD